MALLPKFRLVSLVLVWVFAAIVLGLSADLINITTTFLDGYFIFSALGLATAVITLISFPVLLVVDLLRDGAFTSMIAVELGWLVTVWSLWLATAILASQANKATFSGCTYINAKVNTACHETAGIEGFAFLSWLFLLAYTILLFIFSMIAASRGHANIWTNSVKRGNFDEPATDSANAAPTEKEEPTAPTQYPPTPAAVEQPAPLTHSPYPQV